MLYYTYKQGTDKQAKNNLKMKGMIDMSTQNKLEKISDMVSKANSMLEMMKLATLSEFEINSDTIQWYTMVLSELLEGLQEKIEDVQIGMREE